MIDSPLWDLMLSTRNCLPDEPCSEEDYDMTPERVWEWAKRVGPQTTREALDQLDDLLSPPRLLWQPIAKQTGISFADEANARAWLGKWWDLLVAAIAA